jgi:hypothetical protein
MVAYTSGPGPLRFVSLLSPSSFRCLSVSVVSGKMEGRLGRSVRGVEAVGSGFLFYSR